MSLRRHDAAVIIDMGGGYGGSAFDHLKENGIAAVKYQGAKKTMKRSRDGHMKFTNVRSAAYWMLREALDPGQYQGSPISLPDDPRLRSDLTAPRFELTANGLKITPKDQVVKMLGRSPDDGDAVVMSWYSGPTAKTHIQEWRKDQGLGLGRRAKVPVVNMGRRHH
jgi:hypothetical protein